VYQFRRKQLVRTSLLLQLGNETATYSWHIKDLSFSPGFYKICVDTNSASVRLIEHYCSGTICWNIGIVISNLRLNTKVRLPESVTVYPWELRKIRNILMDQYYIALMVVNGVTSELAEALPIRPFCMSL